MKRVLIFTMQIGPEISIIINECKNSGNMGAAARAVKNMGIKNLIFVRPRQERWLDAIKRAPGAEEILEESIICSNLEKAISDFNTVIGTTNRLRKYRTVSYSLRDLMEQLANMPSSHKLAFVFGSERTGLTNKELNLCQKLIAIPTDEKYPSINLAQAVMIIAYEWHMAKKKSQDILNHPSSIDFMRLFNHIENALNNSNYFDKYPRLNFVSTLTQILYRANLSKREIDFFHGIIHHISSSNKH